MKKGISLIIMVCMLCCLIPAVETKADPTADENGFTVDDTGTLIAYTGAGGAIKIPENVSSIASGVFASNGTITSVTIPSYVTSMGSAVFYDCTGLASVTIEGNIDSIPSQTFYNCTSLSSVTLASTVSSIGSQAFAKCAALGGIALPGTVTSIGEKAFYDCASLGEIVIPAATGSIGSSAFLGCSRMGSITVASGNTVFASADGCLYNGSMTKLIRCPEGKSSVGIAGGTTTIGTGSFANCKGINSLTIPDTVTSIESDAFSGSGIGTIVIPPSVTSIASQGNWHPSAISGYAGSQAQTYATGNGVTFQPLGGSDTGNDNPSDGGTTAPETPKNEGGAVNTGTPSTAGSIKGASGANVISNSHEKDTTPKTGDGINPVFFLCLAVLLVGVYFILMNKKKTARE